MKRLAWGPAFFLLCGSWHGLSAQVVYVVNRNGGNLSTFIVNGEAGTLAEAQPRFSPPGRPTAVAGDPQGRFLYVGDADATAGHIAVFAVNSSNGALARVAGSPFGIGGPPSAMKADPGGKFLYVLNPSGNSVIGFSIDASTGALARIAGTPWGAGGAPSAIAIDPAGRFVFVANQATNNVFVYTIDPASGALTRIPAAPFAVGQMPSRVACDPSGKFLYVTGQGSNDIAGFAIDSSTGALTPVPGSPFPAGAGPTAVVAEASGKFLVVANGDDSTLSVYAIDSGSGSLAPVPGSPFRSQRGPVDAAMDPGGAFVYVANLLDNDVLAYRIDPDTGALAPVPSSPFGRPLTGGGSAPIALGVVPVRPAPLPPAALTSVRNAASRTATQLPNYGVAPGSRFVVSGVNLGPAVKALPAAFPLERQLAGTSVRVNIGGNTVQAIPVSSFVNEVVAILPSSTPLGDGTVRVTYNGQTSGPAPIHIVAASPGIFTVNGAGYGPAQARNVNSDEDRPPNGLTSAARPGQNMVLLATGLGAVTFDETQPAPEQNLRDDVELWVGNRRASVSYSGRSTESPGIDEIRFTVPDDVPLGCYVPIAVRLASVPVTSNFSTIAVSASDRICSDPHGLSATDLAVLDGGGSLNIGWIQLLRANFSATVPGLGSATGLIDSGWAEFFRWDSAAAGKDLGLDMLTGRTVSLGACAVHTFEQGGSGYIPSRTAFLSGGGRLSLAAGGAAGRLIETPFGYYEAHQALGLVVPPGILSRPPAPPFLQPGIVSVDNGSGGRDVGLFQATLTIPTARPPLEWTNVGAIAGAGIDRSTDLTFTWSGGDDSSEYIVVAGAALLFSPDDKNIPPGTGLGAAFVCSERAAAGRITVPAAVLSALPSGKPENPLGGMLLVGRAPFLANAVQFAAKGIDVGYFTSAVFDGTTVSFR